MAISTIDDVVAGLASSQQLQRYNKFLTAPKGAGGFQSSWLARGTPPAGAIPSAYTLGSGYTCDKSTTGAISYTNAALQNYLAKFTGSGGAVAGKLILADRLWSCSGMGFGIATYPVTNPGPLPARVTDGGVGCEVWVEQFVAAGAASGTLTVTYLNSSGVSSSGVLGAVVSAPVIGQMQPVAMAAGDVGVSRIISAANSATWTSGSWGLTILRRLAEIPCNIAAAGFAADWSNTGLAQIPNDACLMLIWAASGAVAPVVIGSLSIVDK